VGGHHRKCPEKGNSASTHLLAATARHNIPAGTEHGYVASRKSRKDNKSPFYRYEPVRAGIQTFNPTLRYIDRAFYSNWKLFIYHTNSCTITIRIGVK
jgi:hypothetical protein